MREVGDKCEIVRTGALSASRVYWEIRGDKWETSGSKWGAKVKSRGGDN